MCTSLSQAEDAVLERLEATLKQLKRYPDRWPTEVQETLPVPWTALGKGIKQHEKASRLIKIEIEHLQYDIVLLTSSTAQGGGGSFKNRKPIGELGCCESGMAERSHWWTERCLISFTLSLSFSLFLSVSLSFSESFSDYLPTYLLIYLSTYLSVCLSISLPIYLSIYLSISLSIYLSTYLSISKRGPNPWCF